MGATVITDLAGDYDGALINHNSCLYECMELPCPKVFTSHGPKHRLEWMVRGANCYVAVSQEVRAVWAGNGFRAGVILNPIDLDAFRPSSGPGTRVLSLCKSVDGMNMVKEATERLGWDFEACHYTENPRPTEEAIRECDVVVGVGRGVYEGLAAGKHVVCFDARGGVPKGEGVVTKDNIDKLAQRNCSGRFYARPLTVSDLADCISLGMDPSWGPKWAEENVNSRTQVDRYLSIVEEVRAAQAA